MDSDIDTIEYAIEFTGSMHSHAAFREEVSDWEEAEIVAENSPSDSERGDDR